MKNIEFNGNNLFFAALGTASFTEGGDEGLYGDIMDAYTDLGGNFLDTAHIYGGVIGGSERILGRYMSARHNREKLFISTKGAHHVIGTEPVGRLSREELKRDSSESMDALKTDHADIYFLHRDNPAYCVGEVMENLQELIEKGVTKAVGASNWSAKRIREANAYAASHGLTPFTANQPQLSLARQAVVEDPSLVWAEQDTLELHAETQMLMTPFSSQAKGFLAKLHVVGEAGMPDKARRRFYTPENIAVYNRCEEVSKKTGISIAALSILWFEDQPFPISPIIGISKLSQLDAMKEAAGVTLDKETRDYLKKLM